MRRRRSLPLAFAVLVLAAACGSSSGGGAAPPVAAIGLAKASVAREPATADDASRGARAVDRFGLALLDSQLGTAHGNVALSPWSIATALTMARAGAAGTTAAEMDRVLAITDPAAAHQQLNGLAQQLATRNGTFPQGDRSASVELSAANQAFAQHDTAFVAAFLDQLARSYGAGVGLVDYVQSAESARAIINRWVSDRTQQRIPALIGPGVLDDLTRLVLVNAVYLKADWQVPFDRARTADAAFHAPGRDVTVPFMHNQAAWGFATGDGWRAVELPYAGNQLAMTILVPDAGRFDDVATHLDEAALAAVSAAKPVAVELALPKFAIDTSLSLKQPLAQLGMPTAFDPAAADFSAMSTQVALYIKDVVHQATITVDEQGTVAAAATAVVMNATSAPAKVEHLDVDRPFLFLLRDKPTGAVLFAGQVTDPAER